MRHQQEEHRRIREASTVGIADQRLITIATWVFTFRLQRPPSQAPQQAPATSSTHHGQRPPRQAPSTASTCHDERPASPATASTPPRHGQIPDTASATASATAGPSATASACPQPAPIPPPRHGQKTAQGRLMNPPRGQAATASSSPSVKREMLQNVPSLLSIVVQKTMRSASANTRRWRVI